MFLNERKLKILSAIINDYIITAEPIGSRTIAKKYDIGLSSATIRNEMSDLEDMGLILQPYTSSGRVPSDKGYRLYVDNIMRKGKLEIKDADIIYNIVKNNIENIEYFMQETAKAISYITRYTAFVSEPQIKNLQIKNITLIPLDTISIIMILLTDNKVIRNHIIPMRNVPNFEILIKMSLILNSIFVNQDIRTINNLEVKEELKKLGEEGKLLRTIFDTILNEMLSEVETEIFTSGVKNILSYPEFNDLNKVKPVFQILEEKDILINILGKDDIEEIKIIIGKENTIEEIKNCSIIRANYYLGNNAYGSVAILGPTRMNYSQVVSVLNEIGININLALNKNK